MKKKILLVVCLLLGLLSGCEEKIPKVVVTSYPVKYLVERIAKGSIECVNISENMMMQRTKIKKNWEDLIADADLLFYINSLEPYMEIYQEDLRDKVEMRDLSTKSAIYKFQRYTLTQVNDQVAYVESPYYEGDVFQNVDSYENDPFLWLDPVAMTSMASDIRDELVKLYPQHEIIFDENYDQLELDLARLDANYQGIYKENKKISFVSMTASFGNWQKSYGIDVYPVCLSKYGALPNNEQLNVIKKRIRNDHVRYMALESNLSDDMKALRSKLISELGLIPINLHNISSLSDDDIISGKDYLSLMFSNYEVLELIAS